jgi:hypothetical protein
VVIKADAHGGVGLPKCKLEVGKKAATTREGKLHATEFAKEAMPRFARDAMAAAHLGEDL